MTTPSQSVIDIAARVRGRKLSAVEAVRGSLARIERHDGSIKAFTQTFDDSAIDRARGVDERVAAGHGDSLPLAGVPIAVKDNICLSLGKTTCASRMLEHYESPFTATAAQPAVLPLVKTGVRIPSAEYDGVVAVSAHSQPDVGPPFVPLRHSGVASADAGGVHTHWRPQRLFDSSSSAMSDVGSAFTPSMCRPAGKVNGPKFTDVAVPTPLNE